MEDVEGAFGGEWLELRIGQRLLAGDEDRIGPRRRGGGKGRQRQSRVSVDFDRTQMVDEPLLRGQIDRHEALPAGSEDGRLAPRPGLSTQR